MTEPLNEIWGYLGLRWWIFHSDVNILQINMIWSVPIFSFFKTTFISSYKFMTSICVGKAQEKQETKRGKENMRIHKV